MGELNREELLDLATKKMDDYLDMGCFNPEYLGVIKSALIEGFMFGYDYAQKE